MDEFPLLGVVQASYETQFQFQQYSIEFLFILAQIALKAHTTFLNITLESLLILLRPG